MPTPPSTWHAARVAEVPYEHWELILDFADSVDHEHAALLRAWSGQVFGHRIALPRKQHEQMITFLTQLRRRLLDAPSLSPEITEDILENYSGDEHEQMVRAVQAVLEESLRQGRPARAWGHPWRPRKSGRSNFA